MKKIAILLALSMMLAGCTALDDLVDDIDANYTTQDLEGTYFGSYVSMRVDMNADNTYDLYAIELWGCYDTVAEAQEALEAMNEDLDDEDTSSTYSIIDDVCVGQEGELVDEEDDEFVMTVTSVLDSTSAIPSITITMTESHRYFECNNGNTIPGGYVNDGEDDCADGEDEAQDAEDDITLDIENTVTVILAADGYGVLAMSTDDNDEGIVCMALAPTGIYQLTMDAMEIIEEAEDNGEEFDIEDVSTIPEDVTLLFASHELAYALSPASTLASGCEGTTFIYNSLFIYMWASALAEDSSSGGDLLLYQFTVTDASGTPTNAANENLVYVSMDSGEDLSWSIPIIQLSVDGGAFIECTKPGQTAGTSCNVMDNADSKWALGEEITISEGSDDLCDQTCNIQIKIIDARENQVIYQSNQVNVS
tara:strand:+ start:117 stop:1382 length:1266 start_codon:yes stop_codon:yes gene_type:complete